MRVDVRCASRNTNSRKTKKWILNLYVQFDGIYHSLSPISMNARLRIEISEYCSGRPQGESFALLLREGRAPNVPVKKTAL